MFDSRFCQKTSKFALLGDILASRNDFGLRTGCSELKSIKKSLSQSERVPGLECPFGAVPNASRESHYPSNKNATNGMCCHQNNMNT